MKTPTPTPTKAQEIELLQRLTVQAREAGADYLHEALIALAVPFENTVRADFPGNMAVHHLMGACRDTRETLAKLQRDVTDARETLRRAIEDTDQAKRETARARNELDEIRQIARRLSAAA
jgi:hypothetical protein